MFAHFKLFSFLILLFSSIWVISYLRQVYKSYPNRVIKAIMAYCIWFILIETTRYLAIYMETNLSSDYFPTIKCSSFALYTGLLFEIYLLLNILLTFSTSTIRRLFNWGIILMSGFLIIGFVLKSFIPEFQLLFSWLNYIESNITFLLKIETYIAILTLIGFYFIGGKSKPKNERLKINKSFILMFFITDMLVIFTQTTGYFNAKLPLGWFMVLFMNSIFLLIPYVWTKFIFLDYAQKGFYFISKSDRFKVIYEKNKISKRESEIIELLIEGKSSNEIKDHLFYPTIPLKTIFHIFM